MTSGINNPYATTTIKSGLRLFKSFKVSSFLRLLGVEIQFIFF